MRILVTGSAGFVGFHVSKCLLDGGHDIFGVDNLNNYYDPTLKRDRLKLLADWRGFHFQKLDLADRRGTAELFFSIRPQRVIHLAAQAGVRHSLTHPHAYVDGNLVAFVNVLEGCRHNGVQHLTYASSSSVYGANTRMPFSVHDNVDHPVSLYAATKKANELMAHSYSHLYGLPTTGLRFFTVYGPWGRPDMALFLFTRAILSGRPIQLFNEGRMKRDFTYIDDIVEGIVRVSARNATPNSRWNGDRPDPGSSLAPYRIYNIGNQHPVDLLRVIEILEDCLGKRARLQLLPMEPGDVPATFADVSDLSGDVGFHPSTLIDDGVRRFVEWYLDYYHVSQTSSTTRNEATRGPAEMTNSPS